MNGKSPLLPQQRMFQTLDKLSPRSPPKAKLLLGVAFLAFFTAWMLVEMGSLQSTSSPPVIISHVHDLIPDSSQDVTFEPHYEPVVDLLRQSQKVVPRTKTSQLSFHQASKMYWKMISENPSFPTFKKDVFNLAKTQAFYGGKKLVRSRSSYFGPRGLQRPNTDPTIHRLNLEVKDFVRETITQQDLSEAETQVEFQKKDYQIEILGAWAAWNTRGAIDPFRGQVPGGLFSVFFYADAPPQATLDVAEFMGDLTGSGGAYLPKIVSIKLRQGMMVLVPNVLYTRHKQLDSPGKGHLAMFVFDVKVNMPTYLAQRLVDRLEKKIFHFGFEVNRQVTFPHLENRLPMHSIILNQLVVYQKKTAFLNRVVVDTDSAEDWRCHTKSVSIRPTKHSFKVDDQLSVRPQDGDLDAVSSAVSNPKRLRISRCNPISATSIPLSLTRLAQDAIQEMRTMLQKVAEKSSAAHTFADQRLLNSTSSSFRIANIHMQMSKYVSNDENEPLVSLMPVDHSIKWMDLQDQKVDPLAPTPKAPKCEPHQVSVPGIYTLFTNPATDADRGRLSSVCTVHVNDRRTRFPESGDFGKVFLKYNFDVNRVTISMEPGMLLLLPMAPTKQRMKSATSFLPAGASCAYLFLDICVEME